MTDREFKALVSLLEDDDPGVEAHVQEQLVSMGESVISKLEQFWEDETNNLVQERIEDIIQAIQNNRTIDTLKDWLAHEEGDLLRAWFLVTQFQYPELEYKTFTDEISRLVNRIWLETKVGMGIPERLMVINRMLYSKEKYSSNPDDLYNPSNYFINGLMDTRKGAPISLGMLYLIVCEKLDIPLQGILLPGYFILTYQDDYNEFFVDVFNKGSFFVRKDLQNFLKEMNEKEDPSYFLPSKKNSIILALVDIVLQCYTQKKKRDKAREWERFRKNLRTD